MKKDETNMILPFSLGRRADGTEKLADIGGERMGTGLLVAGEVPNGVKIRALRTLLESLAQRRSPEEVEIHAFGRKPFLKGLPDLPHIMQRKETAKTLMEAMCFFAPEMENRQGLFARERVRGLEAYNAKAKERMPAIVLVIDAEDSKVDFPFIEGMRPALRQAREAGIFAVFVSRSAAKDILVSSYLTAAFAPWSVLHLRYNPSNKRVKPTLAYLASGVVLARTDGKGKERYGRIDADTGGITWTADMRRATCFPDMDEERDLDEDLKESLFPAGISLRTRACLIEESRLERDEHQKEKV